MIKFIDSTRIYSGHTNTLRFEELPITITADDTLIAFVNCHETGLTITYDDSWNLVKQTEGNGVSGNYGTLICLSHQQTGTTISPSYIIGGLGNNIYCGYVLRFRRCIEDDVDYSVNMSEGRYNVEGAVGTGGITPKEKNSMIITAVGTFNLNYDIFNWRGNNLIMYERCQSGVTYGGKASHLAIATSSKVNKRLCNIEYDITVNNIPADNIAMDVSLTSSSGENRVMNIVEGFHFATGD